MKRSGGFAVVEMLIAALVIAILILGGYYFINRSHHAAIKSPAENFVAASAAPSPSPSPSADTSGTLKIPKFGIQLENIPDSIKDLTYTYYPANTDSNFTEASFTTNALYLKAKNCSIGTLNRYPGKYSADKYQGPGNFVKQFKGFWILEIDEGIPCSVSQTAQGMQNDQIITFKQYVTKSDNLQVLKQ